MINKNSKIFVTGHKGMVGKSIIKTFKEKGYKNIVTVEKSVCDLLNQSVVFSAISEIKPECIIMCAGRVGGIQYNINNPATMLYENTMMNINVLESAHINQVEKVITLGSSCIYPRACQQPMSETDMLTGPFEPTNEMYALAKTMAIKATEGYNKQYGYSWFGVQPPNLYGANDNYNPTNSHFVAANIKKFHDAKVNNVDEVICWGTGETRREVMHVDDLSDGIEFTLQNYNEKTLINIGVGYDYSIKEVITTISKIIGYNGKILWDTSKPEGMPKKLMNSKKINDLGWKSSTTLEDGITKTYKSYLEVYA